MITVASIMQAIPFLPGTATPSGIGILGAGLFGAESVAFAPLAAANTITLQFDNILRGGIPIFPSGLFGTIPITGV